MPFGIKPWHCIALSMLLLIVLAAIIARNPLVMLDEIAAKMLEFELERSNVIQELNALGDEFYATLSPSDRAEIRKGLPDVAREWYPTLFDDVAPAQLPDPTWPDRNRKALRKLREISKKYETFFSVPVSQ